MSTKELSKYTIINIFKEIDYLTEEKVSVILFCGSVSVWLPQTKKKKTRIKEIIEYLEEKKLVHCYLVQKSPETAYYLQVTSTEKLRNIMAD